jgi:4a-hydroxytetrahydrobiopterin dehydratase
MGCTPNLLRRIAPLAAGSSGTCHPALQVSYGCVTIAPGRHDAGGITEKDSALAERIESVLMWRPGDAPGAVPSGTTDEAAHRCIVYD